MERKAFMALQLLTVAEAAEVRSLMRTFAAMHTYVQTEAHQSLTPVLTSHQHATSSFLCMSDTAASHDHQREHNQGLSPCL